MPARLFLIALAACTACFAAHADSDPPRFDGLWCGDGLLNEFSLELKQDSTHAEGTLTRKGRVRHIMGEVIGNRVQTQNTKVGSLTLEVKGNKLRIVDGTGPLFFVRGGSFERSLGSSCG